MKIALALTALLSVPSFAADRLAFTCIIAPIVSNNIAVTLDAQVFASDAVGFNKMVVFINSGLTRKVLATYDVQYRQSRIEEIVNRKNGDVVLGYRNRAAPTREGQILIELNGQKAYRDTICY